MQGTETTRAAIPLPFRSACAATASETSDPEAKIETVGLPLGRRNLIGALRAEVLGDMRPPQGGQVLAGQREDRGRVRLFERRLPALDRLDAVGGPPEIQVRHGAQRGDLLDRLVGRPVLAEPDRIVGEDVHDADLHQRREPQRRAGNSR